MKQAGSYEAQCVFNKWQTVREFRMAAEFNTASILNWKQKVFKEPLSLFIVQAE